MNHLAGMTSAPLVAAASDALNHGSSRTTFEFARLYDFDDPRLFWLLFGSAIFVLGLFAWRVYRKDTIEQKPVIRAVLLLLRVTAIGAAAWFFLGLEKRTDVAVQENSKVVVLVDTSLSMGLRDSDASGVPAGPSRSERVLDALTADELLPRLQRNHDVQLSRFDRQYTRVAAFSRQIENEDAQIGTQDSLPKATLDGSDESGASGDTGAAPEELGTKRTWVEDLTPQGSETHLGDAVRSSLQLGASSPLAAVIVITDGGNNAGLAPESVVEVAQQMSIPIYTVGVGSSAPRRNLRVSELVAPTRAYPGDSFTLTAYLQSQGFAGRIVDVELFRRDESDAIGAETLVDTQQVMLEGDEGAAAIRFELTPTEPGRVVFRLAAKPPLGDVEPKDDSYEVDVDIVEQELQVLLFAGGASREYQFLRNLLYREAGVHVDVLLQSARSGISQDARDVLEAFPSTLDELYKYDCIVAFDPDWRVLDAGQLSMLEKWVSEEAGGLIVVAGPIFTASWLESGEHNLLQTLYPVEFRRRLALLGDARYGSTAAWPIELTRDGEAAEFLKLDDAQADVAALWNQFEGVYGYFAVRGAKPTATVYAHTTDPQGTVGGEPAPYIAGQFYGAGRVVYLGSGEMWRLRALNEAYFEVFYTKLLRHVTEGRLLRGSPRGVLLVERDRFLLGDMVAVRAQLKDEQHRPLNLPSVQVRITRPDSTSETISLAAVENQEGSYLGQLHVLQEGAFQIELPFASSNELPLTKRIHVRVPDLEREHPELDEELLSSLARRTNGLYYAGLQSALFGSQNLKPLADQIASKEEVRLMRGAPDVEFSRQQSLWILGVFCGALGCEWLLRRICKLA